MKLVLLPVDDARTIADLWRRVCEGIDPLEVAFGPEGRDPRPRKCDTYYLIWDDDHVEYRACGDGIMGLVYTQRPAPTTARFGMALLPEYRGKGLGTAVRDAAYDLCFSDSNVWKLESEVYSSNEHSLAALHGKHGRSALEGVQRATIRIGSVFYDRLLYGITRPQYFGEVSCG